MNGRRFEWRSVMVLSAALELIANLTEAQIIDFDGDVELLDPAPGDVRLGALESDTILYVFDEQQNVLLEEDLWIDTTTGDFITPGRIPAGTFVSSHLIHVDPLSAVDVIFFPTVTIFFETEILGFYFKNPPTALHVTDELLGLPGTKYDQSIVHRGAGGFPDLDQITILAEDALTVSLRTFSGNMDEIRVVTRGENIGEDPGLKFTRGDCNSDGKTNLTDSICALNFLFGGAAVAGCLAALDANGDGTVNIADAVSLLNFLFAGGLAPVNPFPDCGPGLLPADPVLGCADAPNC